MLRSSKSTTLAITAASMAALASCTAAHGELIEFTFSGTITEIGFGAPSGYWGDIEVGMPWELSYVFDSRQPDEVPLDDQSGYWQIISGSLMVGRTQASSTGFMSLDLDYFGADLYSTGLDALPDGSQGGVSMSGSEVFDNDDLPTMLDLDAFWSADFVLGVPGAPGGVFNATGPVEDLQIMVIPAPASMALVALVLGRCAAPSRRARDGRSGKRVEYALDVATSADCNGTMRRGNQPGSTVRSGDPLTMERDMLRSSRSTTLAITAASMAALASCTAAHGDLIEFTFSGTITEIGFGAPSGYWGDIEVGMPWELSYVFDSRQPDEVPLDEDYGYWEIVSGSVSVGETGASSSGRIELFLDFAGADNYNAVVGIMPDDAQAGVSMAGPDVFSSDTLPLELSLDWFWSTEFFLGVPGAPAGSFSARGFVEGLSITAVPVPSMLGGFAFGLVGLLRRRRRSIGSE